VATQEELEARVAALEASHADYRAVLAAVNALGANQRDHALDLAAVKTDLAVVKIDVAAVKTDVAGVKTELADFRTETRATFRSVDEHLAEIRDLIIDRRSNMYGIHAAAVGAASQEATIISISDQRAWSWAFRGGEAVATTASTAEFPLRVPRRRNVFWRDLMNGAWRAPSGWRIRSSLCRMPEPASRIGSVLRCLRRTR
jgi:hypothetical protein